MTLKITVPEPVVTQINRINEICNGEKAKTGRVDLAEVARAVGRDPRSLMNAARDQYLPFGWASSAEKCDTTLPVAKVWSWMMCDLIKIADHLEVEDEH